MRRLLFFVGAIILLIFPRSVYAQYSTTNPTISYCQEVCDQNSIPDCQAIVGNSGSFPVCNHSGACPPHWSCTNGSYNSCANNNWTTWSGCVNGAVGETRSCAISSCCDNAAQERACAPNPTSGTGTGATNTPGSGNPPAATNTPVPVGTIRVRAVQVAPGDTSCAAIKAVPTTDAEVDGTTIQFTPGSASQPAPQTQAGANYVQFAGVTAGSYTVDTIPPTADWAYARSCWTDETAGTTGEAGSHALVQNHTLRWDIGYTNGTAWTQTEGGDVYASASIRSYIPSVVPRTFNLDGSAGYPGTVEYGTSCDFDSDPLYNGCTAILLPDNPLLVSSANWQIYNSRAFIDFYDFFYRRFGTPTTPTTAAPFDNLASVIKPESNCNATNCSPYYVVGDMATSTNQWTVGANDKIVILVDGNLTINGNIRITPGGFLAFIVKGNITVSSNVGRTSTDDTPNIEGIYIASTSEHAGTFATGVSSTTDGTIVRFVGQGMFVADNFLLQRDLQTFGVTNTGSSAELFRYNPGLLLSMPDPMKDIAVTWQEVTP